MLPLPAPPAPARWTRAPTRSIAAFTAFQGEDKLVHLIFLFFFCLCLSASPRESPKFQVPLRKAGLRAIHHQFRGAESVDDGVEGALCCQGAPQTRTTRGAGGRGLGRRRRRQGRGDFSSFFFFFSPSLSLSRSSNSKNSEKPRFCDVLSNAKTFLSSSHQQPETQLRFLFLFFHSASPPPPPPLPPPPTTTKKTLSRLRRARLRAHVGPRRRHPVPRAHHALCSHEDAPLASLVRSGDRPARWAVKKERDKTVASSTATATVSAAKTTRSQFHFLFALLCNLYRQRFDFFSFSTFSP